ncbi:hypothetical protein [Almyronema epifaneia]|uniref:Uncharacterized protein n=1 Tax=Almyronema epifaneia S1 TaxID=2991925 RepID=A0ABW6IJM0_9CYAN
MVKDSSQQPTFHSAQTQAELEMLHTVLENQRTYPWNPYGIEVEPYFSELEAEAQQNELNAVSNGIGWQQLASTLDELWAPASQALAADLAQRFCDRVPASFLEQIAQRAHQVAAENQSLLQQLIYCVQDILTAWDSADLQVMARPLALAMRDGHGEVVEVTLRSVRQENWQSLSEIEQARLSLAIARYALGQLDSAA